MNTKKKWRRIYVEIGYFTVCMLFRRARELSRSYCRYKFTTTTKLPLTIENIEIYAMCCAELLERLPAFHTALRSSFRTIGSISFYRSG